VRILLNPDPNAPEDVGGKRQIYLIYNSADVAEKKNAGRIAMFLIRNSTSITPTIQGGTRHG
jgi:hypothetical protein